MRQDEKVEQYTRQSIFELPAGNNLITSVGAGGYASRLVTAVCVMTPDPLTILVSVEASSCTNRIFEANKSVCINVLDTSALSLIEQFMEYYQPDCHDVSLFATEQWLSGNLGQPVLREALGSLEGKIMQILPLGNHFIYQIRISSTWIMGQEDK